MTNTLLKLLGPRWKKLTGNLYERLSDEDYEYQRIIHEDRMMEAREIEDEMIVDDGQETEEFWLDGYYED